MSFGPEVSVRRIEPVDTKANTVRLAPYAVADAAPHFPFPRGDPSLRFLTGDMPRLLRKRNPKAYYKARTDGADVLAWGIWDDATFAGGVEITNHPDIAPSINVLLMGSSRGRGIGTMATAAATEALFTTGLAARYAPAFDDDNPHIVTVINPENVTSQVMCERLGFWHIGFRETMIGRRFESWKYYGLLHPGLAGKWDASPAARLANRARQQTVAKFTIKIS